MEILRAEFAVAREGPGILLEQRGDRIIPVHVIGRVHLPARGGRLRYCALLDRLAPPRRGGAHGAGGRLGPHGLQTQPHPRIAPQNLADRFRGETPRDIRGGDPRLD